MDRKYTVYEHVSQDGKRYIGITSQKVSVRWRHGEGYAKNIHFYRSIQKYGWENFEHNILAENVDEEDAKNLERELIKKYETTDPTKGYNVTRGGDTRQPCPDYVRELISQRNKGKVLSEETKLKISKAKKGVKRGPMSEEQKKKISKSLIGNKFALGKHNNTKTVAMCDMACNILKIYKSAVEAGQDNGCCDSGIGAACKENSRNNGLENTKYGGVYAGSKWFFVDNNGNIVNNNHGHKDNGRNSPLVQYDLQGNKLNEFNKFKEAESVPGISKNGLYWALKRRDTAVYKGFLWVRKK